MNQQTLLYLALAHNNLAGVAIAVYWIPNHVVQENWGSRTVWTQSNPFPSGSLVKYPEQIIWLVGPGTATILALSYTAAKPHGRADQVLCLMTANWSVSILISVHSIRMDTGGDDQLKSQKCANGHLLIRAELKDLSLAWQDHNNQLLTRANITADLCTLSIGCVQRVSVGSVLHNQQGKQQNVLTHVQRQRPVTTDCPRAVRHDEGVWWQFSPMGGMDSPFLLSRASAKSKSCWDSSFAVDDLREDVALQRCTTNKESINVLLLTQFACVLVAHRPTWRNSKLLKTMNRLIHIGPCHISFCLVTDAAGGRGQPWIKSSTLLALFQPGTMAE